MTTINLTKTEAAELVAQGFVAVVYSAYGIGGHQAGDVISKHKTSDAAQKAASKSSDYGVRYLDELV